MGTWTRRIIVAVLIIALVGGGWYFFQQRGAAKAEQAGNFATATVERGDVEKILVETGSIEAGRERDVHAEVSGTVEQVFVDRGAVVEKGEPLFRLSNETLELQARQAQLDYEMALQSLADLLGVSRNEALSTVVPDSSSLATPRAGRITEVVVQPGQALKKGTPVVRLVDDSKILFTTYVNREQAKQLEVGQRATVLTDGFAKQGTPATVTAVDDHGKPQDDVIEYEVELEVNNPGALKAGMTGQADIVTPGGLVKSEGEYQWLTPQTIRASSPGMVDDVKVSVNDWVEAGDTLVVTTSENIASEIDAQRLQVERAQLTLEMRRNDLEELTVNAPTAGVVTAMEVEAGDELRAAAASSAVGEEPLMTITAKGSMEVTVEVDELDITALTEGQSVTVTVDALKGREFAASISEIAYNGRASDGVATFDVTVQLEESEELRPGMTAEVTIPVAKKESVVRVPSEAVTIGEDSGSGVVLVVGEEGPKQRKVEVGLRTDRWTEIIKGLKEGEVVVTAQFNPGNQSPFGPPRRGN